MQKLFIIITFISVLVGCVSQATKEENEVLANVQLRSSLPLKTIAKDGNVLIGAAVQSEQLKYPNFTEVLAREFSQITPENEMKFSYLQPKRGSFKFDKADKIVKFAQKNDMTVKGHTLVWHVNNPYWLTKKTWSKRELSSILETHIKTVVGHYRGRVAYWDVVNEAFTDSGLLRDSIWYRTLGEDYIEMAFRWAHEADPDALLFYNDYSTEGMSPKSNAVYRHIKKLVEKGVPIHGVGTQLHLNADDYISDSSIAKNIERYSKLGLKTHFTEVDVRIGKKQGASALHNQAKHYEVLAKLAAHYPDVDMLTTWGVTDRYSWIPKWYPDYGRPLLLSKNYQPKPAYAAVQSVFLDASMGQLDYIPSTGFDTNQRYIQPFTAKALPTIDVDQDKVIFYPFAFNQAGVADQRLPSQSLSNAKWTMGYHNNILIGQAQYQSLSPSRIRLEVSLNIGGKLWQFNANHGEPLTSPGYVGLITTNWSSSGDKVDFTIEIPLYQSLLGETLGFNIALAQPKEADKPARKLYPVLTSPEPSKDPDLAELFFDGLYAVAPHMPISQPSPFQAKLLSSAPMNASDPVWQEVTRYSFSYNQLDRHDLTIAADDSVSGNWGVGYHENWLYGIVERHDPITITSKQPSYLNDNVEVFLQNAQESMTQFRTVIGQGFEKTVYSKSYYARWNQDGTKLIFAIELNSEVKKGDEFLWNIALANNDGLGRNYQLYSIPGVNLSYLGEHLTKLVAK
ncbi:endo-1,4-beta-xylanase [Vibrio nomapromontoriensis]|uniref:endo-1,4-beta-xylanase n=1 Tax=Vibrio nomapromontoriensis TaxID=2910246 RepID=UPI003D10D9D7